MHFAFAGLMFKNNKDHPHFVGEETKSQEGTLRYVL